MAFDLRSFAIRVDQRDLTVKARVRDRGHSLILLLHGLGCSGASFDNAFTSRALSEYAICALDLPGHGGSDPLGSASTIDNAADVAVQVVRQLAHTRVHVVGHSMGGAVGLLMSQMIQGIESFISIEGNLVAADCGLVSRKIARQTPADFVRSGYGDLLATLAAPGRRDLTEWRSWLSDCDPASVHASARSLVELSETGMLVKKFQKIGRVSYVYGSDSDVSHLDKVLRHVNAREISKAGHFPMVDRPDELYATVATEIGGGSLLPGGSTSTGRHGKDNRVI